MASPEVPSAVPAVAQPPAPPRRRWWFYGVAVLIGLVPFIVFEATCHVFDWGRASEHDDPFVGFRSVVPLFVPSDDGTRYETARGRLAYSVRDSFPAVKSPQEYRIFCLGGSTVQGRPFAIETAFSSWLRLCLEAAEPERTWTVVNCGGVSYATYRLIPILQEVLDYEPDLIILYTGHNEFLESRTFDHVARRGRVLNTALEAASHLRTFTLAREGYLRARGRSSADPPQGRPILPTEVEALLDYRGGLKEYHRDTAWREAVIEQFEFNVRRMIRLAADRDVDVLLVNPVSNFSNSPPFKSQHSAGLSAEQLARWESLCDEASRLARTGGPSVARAAELLEQACQIDPLHAEGFYSLAQCYETTGQFELAREAYLKAKELDVCPLRVLQPMNDAVLDIARDTDTPLVDAQQLFEEQSTGHIVGGYWLVDHVHPSIEGHQLLADALAARLVELGTVHPRGEWQEIKRESYRQHFESLDDLYFMKGTERLQSLRRWAQGRAKLVRPAPRSD